MTTVDHLEDMSTSNRTNATSPWTSLETVEDHQMAHKIDHLSILPNELLDHIFDLAYSIDTPSTGALSKQLLPFHITGIYRRIRLSKLATFLNLMYTIEQRPALARQIQVLKLMPPEDSVSHQQATPSVDVANFLRSLTRLRTLKIDKGYPQMSRILDPNSSLLQSSDLPSLRNLRAPIPVNSYLEPQLSLDRFRTLKSLTLTDYDEDFGLPVPLHPTTLPLVTHLAISGIYADDPSIASLCLACPSLTHLSLFAYEAVYARLLTSLPASLLHLGLDTVDTEGNLGMGAGAEDCSAELSRFPLLRSLSLDAFTFSAQLPTYLSNLQHLEILQLVGDELFTIDLTELLAASARPPSLRILELYPLIAEVGSRLDVDEKGRLLRTYEPKEDDWEVSEDWKLPEDVKRGEVCRYVEIDLMTKAVEQSKVKVRGTFWDALDVIHAYYLELANIAIYRCFRYKTLEPYLELQSQALDGRLPSLDLTTLDPQKLKLVKTELPDEGWFALSLEAADE